MICDYEIRKIDGEETLCLYIDLTYEFARLDSKDKNKKLSQIVKDFIEEKKLKFNGKKIAIISGGLLLATVTLKAPEIYYNSNKLSTSSYPKSVLVSKIKSDNLVNSSDDTLVEVEKESLEKTSDMDIKDLDNMVNKSDVISDVSSESLFTEKEVVSNEVSSVIEDNKIYVTLERTNGTILNMELEEYVLGVVGAEMPASFNTEALKAQAVIARTYALKTMERGLVLTDSSSTQYYKSEDELKAMWAGSFDTYYNKVKNAVAETKGLYLTYNNQLIDAVYHSTSNGMTEDSVYVWGNVFPYLVSVTSPYDSSNSSFIKEVEINYDVISKKLGFKIDSDTDFVVLGKTTGDRVLNISIGGNVITGVNLRNTLGLRSADFDIQETDTGVRFITKGFGHGVGLSQYGANGLAKNGANYETILKHYYTGVNIQKL